MNLIIEETYGDPRRCRHDEHPASCDACADELGDVVEEIVKELTE